MTKIVIVKSLSRAWLCDPMDYSLPRSSVHGIFQARVLEWAAISFSRGSSWPRDRTWVSRIVGRCLTIWATREVQWLRYSHRKPFNRTSPPKLVELNFYTLRNLLTIETLSPKHSIWFFFFRDLMTFGGGGVSWGPEVINSSLKNMEKLNFIYF